MAGVTFDESGITILGENIPYEGIIKVLSDKTRTTHTIVFDVTGEERAFQVRLSPQEFGAMKKCCKQKNAAAYFQPYQVGEGLAIATVACTVIVILGFCAAIAGFKRSDTMGYTFGAVALAAMLANIFVKRKISLMRSHQGDDPKKITAARLANSLWRQE